MFLSRPLVLKTLMCSCIANTTKTSDTDPDEKKMYLELESAVYMAERDMSVSP
jgi:hypothetical protein